MSHAGLADLTLPKYDENFELSRVLPRVLIPCWQGIEGAVCLLHRYLLSNQQKEVFGNPPVLQPLACATLHESPTCHRSEMGTHSR
jgi:hypothetical protein